MSFFDEDDEPTRRAPRPRRPRPAAGPAPATSQELWLRRGVALVVGLFVLLGIVLLVNACQDTARKNSLKDYNREVSALVQSSDREVGVGFFELLQQGGAESPEDLQDGILGFKEVAEQQLDTAERVDTPDELVAAQRSLLIAFELRRDGLQYIAEQIGTATGDPGDTADEAIEAIAGQMQAFLASDVLIQARVTPVVRTALEQEEIGGQTYVATEGFLPDIDWLAPENVATALETELSEGGQNRDPDEPPAPGLHGNGLVSVGVGDITLQPAGVANRIPAGDDVTFAVKFANQGENDEFDVQVVVTLDPTGGGKAIRARRTIDTIAQGSEATANLALPTAPAAGEVYEVTVEVKPVPGEEKTDNNKQTYNVLFE